MVVKSCPNTQSSYIMQSNCSCANWGCKGFFCAFPWISVNLLCFLENNLLRKIPPLIYYAANDSRDRPLSKSIQPFDLKRNDNFTCVTVFPPIHSLSSEIIKCCICSSFYRHCLWCMNGVIVLGVVVSGGGKPRPGTTMYEMWRPVSRLSHAWLEVGLSYSRHIL